VKLWEAPVTSEIDLAEYLRSRWIRPPRPDTGRVGANEKTRGHAGERQRVYKKRPEKKKLA